MSYPGFHAHRGKAQAIVEFAIALPILLLLLYGILETGRLLFIYSSVVTASRQAARYGSATGEGVNNAVPRYQDCEGMRDAANAAAYISTLDDSEIDIQYDGGPGTSQTDYCFGTVDTSLTTGILSDNKHRIVVTVNEQFDPMVPGIVPFLSRTISATSSRTVLVSVAIVVTAPPATWQASTPTNTPSPTPSPTNTPTHTATFTASPTLQFTFTPSGTSTASPIPTITNIPTITPIPSTPITGCNSALTLGLLTKSGNTMSLTVSNSHAAPLQLSVANVQWNHDKGHQLGSDKSLVLQSASIGSPIWTGSESGPSYPITPTSPGIFPAGSTVTLTFTFHQSYDNWDNTESVTINLATPGCEGVVFFQNVHQ